MLKFSDRLALAALPLPFTTLGLRYFTFSGQYIPEVYVALWALLAFFGSKRRLAVARTLLLSKRLMVAALVVVVISLISGFRADFDFVSFYGRLRAILLAVAGFFVVVTAAKKGWKDGLTEALIVVCSSAAIMYALAGVMSAHDNATKTGISMLCFSIACCLLIERGRVSRALLIASLGVIAAYLSFFRQNYFIAAALYIAVFVFSIAIIVRRHPGTILIRRQGWVVFALPVASAFLGFYFWHELSSFLSSSESRYIQSVGKMLDLFEFLRTGAADESSNSRLESFTYIFNNVGYYILPNGLINDSSLTLYSLWGGVPYYAGASVPRDSVLAYLVVTFGVLPFLAGFFVYMRECVRSVLRHRKEMIVRTAFLAPALIAVFFLDGATLTQVQKSLFFGVALALLITPKLRFDGISNPRVEVRMLR